jgi:hypothetical protein
VAVCALALIFAAGANAAVTVGQLFTPTFSSCLAGTALQTVVSGNGYAVSSPGVITSWSWEDGDTTDVGLEFKVGRHVSGDDYTIVGSSVAGTQAPNTVVSFPVRIPVKAGDVIGVFVNGGSGDCASNVSNSDTYEFLEGVNAALSSTTTYGSSTDLRFPVAAQVEPDADGDGFGDETQDRCPTNSTTQGTCPAPPPSASPAPDTTPPSVSISSTKSAKLSKSGGLSFTMTSSEAATGSATGTISLPSAAKTVRFNTAKVNLVPGKLTKISLKLSKSNLKKVRKVLKHHKLKAKVTVTVKDSADNTSIKKLIIKLKH